MDRKWYMFTKSNDVEFNIHSIRESSKKRGISSISLHYWINGDTYKVKIASYNDEYRGGGISGSMVQGDG